MISENFPGKHSSEKDNFYFSCDTEDSVLVGVKDGSSICPVVGMQLVTISMEQLVYLEANGKRLTGDMIALYSIDRNKWDTLFADTPQYKAGYLESGKVVFATTDFGSRTGPQVLRLHMAFA